jgi:hypothetical protein
VTATKRHAILVHVVEYQIANRDSGEFYRLITTITDWEEALSPGPGRRLPPTLGRHTAGPNACTPQSAAAVSEPAEAAVGLAPLLTAAAASTTAFEEGA